MEFALGQAAARPNAPMSLAQPIGLEALPTPALVLERGAMERNMRKMADHLQRSNKGFRPHSKTHKCPTIAALQMGMGAAGVCAAKISEAAIMLAAGIPSVLITSPIATFAKARALNALLAQYPEHQLLMVIDSDQGLAAPHCDPTVNLHDYYWVLEEDGLVHSVWPISARGCSW